MVTINGVKVSVKKGDVETGKWTDIKILVNGKRFCLSIPKEGEFVLLQSHITELKIKTGYASILKITETNEDGTIRELQFKE